MKKFKNIVMLLISCIAIISCETDDKTVDGVLENVERGAILRTINSATTYNFFDVNDSFFKFEIGVEAQDISNGDLVSEIRLYQSFIDNTEDAVDNSKTEVLISTAPKSSLTESSNGLPAFDTTLLLSEALALNGLSSGQYFGGDQFVYRFELELTDGRIFSDDVGGTVSGGSFFTAPFAYTSTIKCVPVVPFAGDYTLNIKDSYGDGWDGAFITVTIDGTATNYTTDGAATVHTVNVPSGTSTLEFSYTDGAFEGEHSYVISYNGLEAAADGPGPGVGTIFLNICP